MKDPTRFKNDAILSSFQSTRTYLADNRECERGPIVSFGVGSTGTFWPRLATFDVYDQITTATTRAANVAVPVVWIAYYTLNYRRFTRWADLRLPPGCYGKLIVSVKRNQSRPKRARGVDPDRHDWATFTFTIIGEVTFLLCWNAVIVEAFLKRVGSFLSISYHANWLISMLVNRRAPSWGVCVWTDPLTICNDYRICVRDVWKSARRVSRIRQSTVSSFLFKYLFQTSDNPTWVSRIQTQTRRIALWTVTETPEVYTVCTVGGDDVCRTYHSRNSAFLTFSCGLFFF